ncbi:hypothetical protein EDB85DRAFT_1896360 [Lactarius pseudohatsudake]|nr:hypothetical protein EDB85DRAFT_1896360 [Lactarius pseudohatsudake]
MGRTQIYGLLETFMRNGLKKLNARLVFIWLTCGKGEETVDSETEHWPVPAELRSQLDEIKHEYRAAPLHIYKSNQQFVEPADVNATLEDSLVEIPFEFRHYCFR